MSGALVKLEQFPKKRHAAPTLNGVYDPAVDKRFDLPDVNHHQPPHTSRYNLCFLKRRALGLSFPWFFLFDGEADGPQLTFSVFVGVHHVMVS